MIDVTHICICLDYPKLYTNMATGNDVTSHENDLLMSTGARDCLPPQVRVILMSGRVAKLSFNRLDNAELIPSLSRWLQSGRFAEIGDL